MSFWLASSRLPFGFNKILTLQHTLTAEYGYRNSCIDQFLSSVVYKDLHQYCHLATHCDYSCPFGQNCVNQLSYGSNSELITLFSMHYSSFSWKLDYNFLQQAWLTDNFQGLNYGCLLIIFLALWVQQNLINRPYGVHSESMTLFSMHYSSFSWKLDYNFLRQAWLTDNIFMLSNRCAVFVVEN